MLFISLVYNPICGQKFNIIRINASNYPEIEASYEAVNLSGEVVRDARLNDFFIQESNQACEILKVQNPDNKPIPLSMVVMTDVSTSMEGGPLSLAKEGIKDLVKQFPLDNSEMAVASFSKTVSINSDYSQDRKRLIESSESLSSSGGTDFPQAFHLDKIGALPLSQNGLFKKCIVFITDGLGWISAPEVIKEARENNILVFTIILEKKSPEALKAIAMQTGGICFESIKNIEQFRSLNAVILQNLQSGSYGKVFWKALSNCEPSRKTLLKFRNQSFNIQFDIPAERQGLLETDPSMLLFGTANPGAKKEMPLVLTAKNINFTNIRLSVTNNQSFSLADSMYLPFSFQTGKSKIIPVFYKPHDAGLTNGKILISSNECPEKSIAMSAGSEEMVRILFPVGNEILPSGIDTTILWEGIKKNRKVQLFLRQSPKTEWKYIGEGRGFHFPWKVPQDTGHHYRIKIIPLPDEEEEMKLSARLKDFQTSVNSFFFNPQGNQIVTTERDGVIKTWDSSDGHLFSSLSGYNAKTTVFCKTDQRLAGFTQDEILVWEKPSSKIINRLPFENKRIFTSYSLPDGTEMLITSLVLKDKAKTTKIWDPVFNKTTFLFSEKQIKAATINAQNYRVVTLDETNTLQIWDSKNNASLFQALMKPSFSKAIVSASGQTVVLHHTDEERLVSLTTGKEIATMPGLIYQQFSPLGSILVLKDLKGRTCFIDPATGNYLKVLNNVQGFHFSPQNDQLLYFKNDSLMVINLLDQKTIYQAHNAFIRDAVWSGDGSRIILIRQENEIEFIDPVSGNTTANLNEFDQKIQSVQLSPNGKQLAILMNNQTIQVWTSRPKNETKGASSEYFTVISPKPQVKPEIRFDDVWTGSSGEFMENVFIHNPSNFPIQIQKMEIAREDSMTFKLVSNNYPKIIPPQISQPEEFRFIPLDSMFYKGKVFTYTSTDTFVTFLTGKSRQKPFQTISKTLDLGKIPLSQSHDSIITLIKNLSSKPLLITSIEQGGPDMSQFSWNTPKLPLVIPAKDSLRISVKYTAIKRGITSGSIRIKPEGIKEPELIYLQGEGLSPRRIWIKGKTLQSMDSLPLPALVRISDLENPLTHQIFKTDTSGTFLVELHADRNYRIAAEKKDYISGSEHLDLSLIQSADTLIKNIYLSKITEGNIIRLHCIFFESGKFNLLKDSNDELEQFAALLKSYPNLQIEVRGHTDSIGNDSDNLLLSKNRSQAVYRFLVQKGIAPMRMKTSGFGESMPAETNSTEEGRKQNRRVEIKIIKT